MTDFARVNNGIAFSGPFTTTNANDLRTNGELLWRSSIDDAILTEITSNNNLFSAPAWDPLSGALFLSSGTIGGNNRTMFASRRGAIVSDTALTPIPGGTCQEPIIRFVDESTGYYFAAATGVIHSSQDPVVLTSGSSVGSISITPRQSFAPQKMAANIAVVPIGSAGRFAAPGIARITTGAAGTVSSVTEGVIGTVDCEGCSIATNGTLCVGVCRVDSTLAVGCNTTGAAFPISAPTHASADYQTQSIGYDSRTALFVRMMTGLSAGAYPRSLMWVTSADGTTWSGTTGWKRLDTCISRNITLGDFTITRDGIWLAIASCARGGAGGYREHILFSSIDSGATWVSRSIGLLPPTPTSFFAISEGFRFGNTQGDGWAAILQGRPSAYILIGGAVSAKTELSSVSV